MEILGKSNNDYIPTLPVVQASTEDMKCFPSFLHKLRSVLSRDGAICVAPPPEWCDKSFPLPKASKMKMRRQPLLQPPFASLEVFKKVELDQCKVRTNRSLDIQNSCERACNYQFVTSQEITTVEAHQTVSEGSINHIGPFLAFHTKLIVATTMLSTFVMRKLRFGNWCSKASARRQLRLVCARRSSQRSEWHWEWEISSKNFTDDWNRKYRRIIYSSFDE